ncbi:MAG TPA: UDP-2,4-diacetamido-2,4,6-trideoxy-beta-L-altropyranose hydrolase [Candidatus Limnocylindrales bacterium]|nr:UDP-2,4-diacetamido-2,4,6-trideoxy-beta-L-altropyranose hydrolase [Candidatus Limnocylindrales bacterium]
MILVRTDASTALGTGHAMRCLALAQALRDRGSDVTLAAAAVPEAIADRYRAEGAHVARFDAETASQADVAATLRLAERLRPDWLVVDGYTFDDGYVDAVATRVPLLLIDDRPRDVATPALLLNQNGYATRGDYPGLGPAQLLLGPSHALLRREYATPPPARRVPSRGDRILVTLGGADPDNVTARVLAVLADRATRHAAKGTGVTEAGEVRVVIGAAHPAADAVEDAAATAGFTALRDIRDMRAEADRAHLAIGAAGTTSLELASRGLPAIHAVLMDNQVRVAAEMERRGVSISAGAPDAGFEARLDHAIEALREPSRRAAMSAAGRALVDGHGARRVAARLLGEARGTPR